MRLFSASSFAAFAVLAAACGAGAPDSAGGADGPADASRVACGPSSTAKVDGSCAPVGARAPAAEIASAFPKSLDGWGYTALAGDHCSPETLSVLGEPSCQPVDDCSAPFPPAEAEVVVSQTTTGPKVVSTLDEALAKVSTGGVVAVDAGHYGSLSLKRDVTLVGRCARDAVIGDGKHNAVYVNGPKVKLRGMTLESSSSPIAVAKGSIDAERVVLRKATVSVGAVGASSKVTLRRSLVLGSGPSSLGVMAGEGGVIVVEDSAIRDVTSGVLATDPGSRVELRRSIVDVLDGVTSSGLEASAHGHIEAENVAVRSSGARLVAVHKDVGTSGRGPSASGTATIVASVLEQQGEEMTDAPAIFVEDGELALSDVTLRHQAPIGLLVKGKATASHVTIAGSAAPAELRAAIAIESGSLDAESLAIPWAQGVGLMVDEGADLTLRESLVANVVDRGEGKEGILLSGATASLSDCELTGNAGAGLVAIGGSAVTISRSLLRDNASVAGALILSSSTRIEDSVLARNGEGVIGAGGAVLLTNTELRSHGIALRAMDGMRLRDGADHLDDGTLSFAGCRFLDNAVRSSSEKRPELDAYPFPKTSRK